MFKMKKKSILTKAALATLMVGQVAYAADADYNVLDRFRLMEDKFQTQEFLREPGHDFLIDMSVYANTDIMELASDVSDAEDSTAAAEVLSEYADTEQNLRVNVEVGVPLPSFSAFKGTISPSVRLGVNVGSLIGIGEEDIEKDTLIAAIPADASAKTILEDKLTQDIVNDVLAGTTNTVSDLATALGLSGSERTQFETELTEALGGTAIPFAGSGQTAAIIDAYVKADVTAGLNFDYKNENHFGGLSLYGLYRADVRRVLDQDAIAGDGDAIDTENLDQNMTLYAMADITYGFNWLTNFRTMFKIQDIALATIIESDEGYLPIYEPEVGYRMHTDYSFDLSNLKLRPFVGFHMRDGYDFADGVYAGTDVMLHVWKQRIALTLRGMVDSEHLTLTPRFKLGFMDFMYSLKQPITSEVKGVEIATIHSVNFRLHF
ncbi:MULTISPECIES: hypothetical protein [Halobacteriovorax]|uniref:Uncharacterized protein n=1 Tax=Halobacteriovorax vibrionivorans TaxID=2152716 RepID=A0ABY0IHR2_9BACT|nr:MULTISPECIES: hypothetical protein [Halobacteriovorax]RZF20872.1 hypothetical protein DAY19_12880 [Halobacteriovorax vibrionivorans]TGD46223.1 hypothetical protein EP118_12890 [Halobacteriovorax sp. Y22]